MSARVICCCWSIDVVLRLLLVYFCGFGEWDFFFAVFHFFCFVNTASSRKKQQISKRFVRLRKMFELVLSSGCRRLLLLPFAAAAAAAAGAFYSTMWLLFVCFQTSLLWRWGMIFGTLFFSRFGSVDRLFHSCSCSVWLWARLTICCSIFIYFCCSPFAALCYLLLIVFCCRWFVVRSLYPYVFM